MIREPAVAGRFYPADIAELARQVRGFAVAAPWAAPRPAIGCVVPHAGYMYSGHVAGAVFAAIALPRRFVILCPRHYREGQPLAIMSEGAWRTPLGDAKIDSALALELKRASPMLREDSVAHRYEHSLEVQLPFLQHLAGEFTFVPVAMAIDRFPMLDEFGRALAEVVKKASKDSPVLIVASSDMNHYESDAVTRVKDQKAIDRMLKLDARGLFDTVRQEGITMCGYGPATAMLIAAKLLGAQQAELVRYATSGDVSGDRDEVVGYAGLVVH